jgi:hypothetical protein
MYGIYLILNFNLTHILIPSTKYLNWENSINTVKGKGKVFTVLLIRHHALKAYWGSGDIAPHILDLGTRWEWVVRASCPSCFTHCIGYWVGPRAGLDVAKRKIPSPARTQTPDHPACSLTLYHWAILGSYRYCSCYSYFRDLERNLKSKGTVVPIFH